MVENIDSENENHRELQFAGKNSIVLYHSLSTLAVVSANRFRRVPEVTLPNGQAYEMPEWKLWHVTPVACCLLPLRSKDHLNINSLT